SFHAAGRGGPGELRRADYRIPAGPLSARPFAPADVVPGASGRRTIDRPGLTAGASGGHGAQARRRGVDLRSAGSRRAAANALGLPALAGARSGAPARLGPRGVGIQL